MKINRHPNPKRVACTLAQFAEQYGLTMDIRERDPGSPLPRFFCSFSGVGILGNGVISYPHGDGDTEEAAMGDYMRQISGEIIRIGRGLPVDVPALTSLGL